LNVDFLKDGESVLMLLDAVPGEGKSSAVVIVEYYTKQNVSFVRYGSRSLVKYVWGLYTLTKFNSLVF